MSDDKDNNPNDKTHVRQEANDEQTVIRGQNPRTSHSEPGGNDDATVVRKPDNQNLPEEGNNDETVLRAPKSNAQAPEGDDETVLRPQSRNDEDSGDETVLRTRQPNLPESDDETVLRSETKAPVANDDETVLRTGANDDGGDDATVLRSPSESRAPSGPQSSPQATDDAAAEATILRGGASGDSGGGEATILRDPGGVVSSDSATILRGPGDDAEATILRGGSDAEATILRGDDDDDATIIRDGMDDDDDRTIINDNIDDDSTVIGSGGAGKDTTYIASVGKQIRPKGNSEAGRLLKNRFVLEEKIGSGGMGDVYKALDLRQQEAQERDPYIAIKLLNENFARHKDAFLSLQRETSRTRGIPHPNIMAVYDFDREGDTVFMSMELLDGKPLDDYLKEHPEGVSQEDAWRIIDGISSGLNRAHNAGIVHSDFKPGNIFYTKDKMAKVFDFGIARAVSNPNDLEADGEKTVFDAGSLGALTPTYASYEMLKGMEPSKSDDVYAVALVAYELFMGKHPYDRVPADKAYDRGLKPKPVPFLKRRHWKALKKALELRGENRTQTIDEFHEGMFSEDPPYLRYAAIATVALGSIGFGAYQATNQKEMPDALASLHDVMASSEMTIRNSLDDVEEGENPNLWESDVFHDTLATALTRWRGAELQILDETSEEAMEWQKDWEYVHNEQIDILGERILDVYLEKIDVLRQEASTYSENRHTDYGVEQAITKLQFADSLMDRVEKSYKGINPSAVQQMSQLVDVRLAVRQDRYDEIVARESAEEEARELARLAAEEADRIRRFEENRLNTYNSYLVELNDILKCKGDLPDEDVQRFGQLLGQMRSEWQEAYSHHHPTIVGYMSRCIGERIGLVNPERAREVQTMMVSYLPEKAISGLVIEDKDPCDERGLVGRGDRNRNWCVDELLGGGQGPDLVVIPPEGVNDFKYAISRAEIRIADYNLYCQAEGCDPLPGASSLPVTNLSIAQAREYTRWLSSRTGHKYRLPTVDEWEWAVLSEGTTEVDENINCTVDSRGVRLGEKLLNAVSGRPNPWGLYNYVGNAREWAVSKDDSLLAMGGAHTDPRQECTLQKRVAHNGAADPVTGFRVLREIEDKSRKSEAAPDLAASE